MSEHLEAAVRRLKFLSGQRSPTAALDDWMVEIESMIGNLTDHLKAQQETPASETSFAPTTGPVEKHLASCSATRGASTASLAATSGWFHLTVKTGDSTKSISYTLDEWAAIRSLFSGQKLTSPSPIRSGETKAGDHGPVVPDSPASSPEPVQGGNDEQR